MFRGTKSMDGKRKSCIKRITNLVNGRQELERKKYDVQELVDQNI
jgi:hypothetical protein